MIWRLRNAPKEGRAFFFWNSIDPINQTRLLNYFGVYHPQHEVRDILNMLIWYFNNHFPDAKFKDVFTTGSIRRKVLEQYSNYLTEMNEKK